MPASSELISTNAETGRSIGKQNSNAMQTNYLKCLCLILLILAAGTTDAQNFEVNGIYYNVLSEEEGTVEVTRGNYSGDVVIPAEVSHAGTTYRVTTIGISAFEYCKSLTSVSMPSVTMIGDSAFQQCDALTSVSMPSVKTIGVWAFYYCPTLESVNMPSVTTIGFGAFASCYALESVNMPSVTTIGEYAFDSCDALESIDIPASVTEIGSGAFLGIDYFYLFCHWQEPLELEDSPFDIRYDAKGNYIGGQLYVPVGTTSAYKAAYPWKYFRTIYEKNEFEVNGLCYNIVSEKDKTVEVTYYYDGQSQQYNISPGGESIFNTDRYTGYKGDQNIPEKVSYEGTAYTVVSIGNHAFANCSGLKSLTIPASVTTIGQGAFYNCNSLTSVDMPSVTEIGDNAFYDCSSLASVDMPSVTEIGDNAFYDCSSLASVDMPSVTEIGNYTFSDCHSLGSVDIPASTTSIGDGVFASCNRLIEISVHKSNNYFTSINGVLYDKGASELVFCPNTKTSLVLPNTVIKIKGGAFSGSNYIGSVDMPSVTEIGDNAFYDCSSLASVDMPSVKKIGDNAFYYCGSLASPDMPSVTEIGNRAFCYCYCRYFTSADMPLVTEIGDSAFYHCDYLIQLIMPSATSIGSYAFSGCDLSAIDIPASVTSIGYNAFTCPNLLWVQCNWQEPLRLKYDPFNNNFFKKIYLHVPVGTKWAYGTTYPWSEFYYIDERNHLSIDETEAITPTVTVIDGAIVIEGDGGTMQPVEVYTTGGECVYRGTDSSIGGLGRGVYVVKVGGTVQKVAL